MSGVKRNIEQKVKKLLDIFPVVVILGARQVGKTVLSKRVTNKEWRYFDLEKPEDFDVIHRNPSFFFKQYSSQVIIDEAQESPELFRILRGVVDEAPNLNGRFILTGSSSPDILHQASDTLAGRAAFIELGTLKANEYHEKPLSEFYKIFEKKLDIKELQSIIHTVPYMSLLDMTDIWLRGGYPKPLLHMKYEDYDLWMESYRDSYINRDIAKLFPRLNKSAYQRFLSVIAGLSTTIMNKSEVARTIQVSEPTVTEYLSIMENTFLWRSLPSYEKNVMKAVVKMPKGYIRDTGLFHFLNRISDLEVLLSHFLLGASFEAFVVEELLKGLESTLVTNWSSYYYRTRNGAEIDLILEGTFGTLPIEIKYGNITKAKQLTALISFIEEHRLPFGIVINRSERVEWITEKVLQIPVNYL